MAHSPLAMHSTQYCFILNQYKLLKRVKAGWRGRGRYGGGGVGGGTQGSYILVKQNSKAFSRTFNVTKKKISRP